MRELVPRTRSRNTLPGKYPNQYTRRTRRESWMMKKPDWGMGTKKIQQFDWPTADTSFHGKQISLHTKELAPETDSCNIFAPGACSLLSNQFDVREQKFCCATYIFATNRWCRRGSFAPEACCRSVLREQAPSCLPAFILRWMPAGVESIKHETIDLMSRTTAVYVRYKSVCIS